MPTIPVLSTFVSVVALRTTGDDPQVLLLQRAETLVGAWCQVAGGLEAGETAPQAALRELSEETGLTPEALFSADTCEQFYEPRREAILIAPVFVAWIASDATVRLNHEHTDFRWVDFDAAMDLVDFGGQRRVLSWIREEFVHRTPSPHLRIPINGTRG